MPGCENCSGCSGCASGGGCSGCGGTLTLTAGERDFLMELAQIPFLPVARKASEETPVYLEAGEENREAFAALLLALERKGLVSLDYDIPMKRYPAGYEAYPVRGSISLTNRGQQVLELLDIQGIDD